MPSSFMTRSSGPMYSAFSIMRRAVSTKFHASRQPSPFFSKKATASSFCHWMYAPLPSFFGLKMSRPW